MRTPTFQNIFSSGSNELIGKRYPNRYVNLRASVLSQCPSFNYRIHRKRLAQRVILSVGHSTPWITLSRLFTETTRNLRTLNFYTCKAVTSEEKASCAFLNTVYQPLLTEYKQLFKGVTGHSVTASCWRQDSQLLARKLCHTLRAALAKQAALSQSNPLWQLALKPYAHADEASHDIIPFCENLITAYTISGYWYTIIYLHNFSSAVPDRYKEEVEQVYKDMMSAKDFPADTINQLLQKIQSEGRTSVFTDADMIKYF